MVDDFWQVDKEEKHQEGDFQVDAPYVSAVHIGVDRRQTLNIDRQRQTNIDRYQFLHIDRQRKMHHA
ncbi:hypothetical protein F2Q68_00014870 [Brassica cretica]|uniref:Uncharacterized protein n=1 Tax=Brassica cretica TaxID=69181 RepID=A0A8S9HHB0_BRACR|nr:hypothetical protein F2Q68_00014870 [Brassica cretica]